jgi:hypothetical protein
MANYEFVYELKDGVRVSHFVRNVKSRVEAANKLVTTKNKPEGVFLGCLRVLALPRQTGIW